LYVCLCMGITDREARAAIAEGARTAGEVLRACRSARPCGGCTPTLRQLLRQAQAETGADAVIQMDRYREVR
jgi:bacterioferritin-associated ferredoxin